MARLYSRALKLFGPKLKRYRNTLLPRPSEDDLADVLKVGRDTYRSFEKGSRLPAIDQLDGILSIFLPSESNQIDQPNLDELKRMSAELRLLYDVEGDLLKGVRVEDVVSRYRHFEYRGNCWLSALSIFDHPHLDQRQSWPAADVRFEDLGVLDLSKQRSAYQAFCRNPANEKKYRLFDDRTKFAVVKNPRGSDDSDTLCVEVKRCKWSEAMYYQEEILPARSTREQLIEQIVEGDLTANFPQISCLHLVVLTKDEQILVSKRSGKNHLYPGVWSTSAEEGLDAKDFTTTSPLLNTGRRLVVEELGLTSSAFDPSELRILSVFIDADPPSLHISFCGRVRLDLKADMLMKNLRYNFGGADKSELTRFDFLPFREKDKPDVLRELFGRRSDRQYHPTSGYRLLMLLINEWKLEPKDWLQAARLA
jgi:DNA-binding XRE family transcriptional regulator